MYVCIYIYIPYMDPMGGSESDLKLGRAPPSFKVRDPKTSFAAWLPRRTSKLHGKKSVKSTSNCVYHLYPIPFHHLLCLLALIWYFFVDLTLSLSLSDFFYGCIPSFSV